MDSAWRLIYDSEKLNHLYWKCSWVDFSGKEYEDALIFKPQYEKAMDWVNSLLILSPCIWNSYLKISQQ